MALLRQASLSKCLPKCLHRGESSLFQLGPIRQDVRLRRMFVFGGYKAGSFDLRIYFWPRLPDCVHSTTKTIKYEPVHTRQQQLSQEDYSDSHLVHSTAHCPKMQCLLIKWDAFD